MKMYLFVLGRDPQLSKIEIESYLESKKIKFEILDSNENIVMIRISKFDKNWVNDLGGTIKIAEVFSNSDDIQDIEENLEKADLYQGRSNKIIYCISRFNTNLDSFVADYLKEYFKNLKVKAMFKKELDPSSLIKKDLIENCLDIVVYKNFIAKTIAVSNLLDVKERDLGRPNMEYIKAISIRLAKILINLSKVKESQLLLDPFCGNGTILQEALLRGIDVIGLDNESKSIEYCKSNLEWLRSNYNIKSKYNLIKLDSRELESVVKRIDGIVTEPYMGPFIRRLPSMNDAKNLVFELTQTYNSVLKQGKSLLDKGQRIVIIIPRFRTREGKTLFIDIESLAKSNGFDLRYKPVKYAYKKSRLIRDVCVLEKD